jgi:DNA polymerase
VQQPAAGPAGEPGLGWTISPAQLVYPHAPQHVHSAEQGGWLILLEPAANPPLLSPAQRPAADSAQTALQGDAAKLLDNMLRALGLQEKPRVFSAALHRAPPDADLSHAQALQPALEACCASCAPTACWFWAWPVHAPCWAAMMRWAGCGPSRTTLRACPRW